MGDWIGAPAGFTPASRFLHLPHTPYFVGLRKKQEQSWAGSRSWQRAQEAAATLGEMSAVGKRHTRGAGDGRGGNASPRSPPPPSQLPVGGSESLSLPFSPSSLQARPLSCASGSSFQLPNDITAPTEVTGECTTLKSVTPHSHLHPSA